VLDVARGVLTRLTSEDRNARAIWTPDGTRITYGSASAGTENLFWRPADGSGTPERLTTSEYQDIAGSWSPDGSTLLFMKANPVTQGWDIWVLPLAGDRHPRPLVQTRSSEGYGVFSPDGRWMAYASTESGRSEVYVQSYPGPGPRQQISRDGGTAPVWARDGRELFYTTTESVGGQPAPTKMMAVPVRLQPTFTAAAPRMLFQGDYGATAGVRGYDVTPDGRRFLMVEQKQRAGAVVNEMVLVQNWIAEVQRRVPGAARP
jgi:Tol biopolymer transport system component